MKGKILLTGYEPFLDMRVNPSMEAIRLLDGMQYHGYEVVIEELPMRYAEIRNIIRSHVDKHKPAAVICTGVSSIGTGIAVERVAINVGSADGGPNFGYKRLDQILNPYGPAAYWSTLPIREIVEDINLNGIPAYISNSAGTQGCNLVFYHLMDYISEANLGIPGGFIHVPRLPQNAANSRNPSMNLLDSAKAIEYATNITASKLP